jgi:hypothetical protein
MKFFAAITNTQWNVTNIAKVKRSLAAIPAQSSQIIAFGMAFNNVMLQKDVASVLETVKSTVQAKCLAFVAVPILPSTVFARNIGKIRSRSISRCAGVACRVAFARRHLFEPFRNKIQSRVIVVQILVIMQLVENESIHEHA